MIVLESHHAVRLCNIVYGILVQCHDLEDFTCSWSTEILGHGIHHLLAWLDFTKNAKLSLSTVRHVTLPRSSFCGTALHNMAICKGLDPSHYVILMILFCTIPLQQS